MKNLTKKCKCGGTLIGGTYIKKEEGETYDEFIERIKFIREEKVFVYKCDKCFRVEIYDN